MGSHTLRALRVWVMGCLVVLACYAQGAFASAPKAVRGVIDAARWDFSNESLPLAGDWEFYYGEWIHPDVFAKGVEPEGKTYVTVPGSWRQVSEGTDDPLPRYGYGTYRLKVRVAPNQMPLALSLLALRTAHQTWVNGQLMASSGVIGTSRAASEPGSSFEIVVLPAPGGDTDADIDIVIHVANYHFREGGIPWVPVIGKADHIFRDVQKQLALEVFFVASLLVIGLYHLAAWALRKQDKHGLYFALFCLVIVPRTAVIGHLAFFSVQNVSWEWQRKWEYLGFFAGLPLFLLFIDALYKGYFGRRSVRMIVAVSSAYCAAVLLFPTWIHSRLLVSFELFTVVVFLYMTVHMFRIGANKEANSRFVSAMMVVVFGTAIHDMLYFWRMFNSRALFPMAIYGMVLAHSIILSRRFATEFERQKTLAIENAKLLNTVEGQMSALRQSRRFMMERDEEVRRHVTDVLHGTVQGRLVSARHYLQKALRRIAQGTEADEAVKDVYAVSTLKTNEAAEKRPEDSAAPLKAVRSLIMRANDELERVSQQDVRGIGKMLHPLTIDLGLSAALEELADRFAEHVQTQVQVSDTFKTFEKANVEIVARGSAHTPTVKSVRQFYLAAYRIVEEALNNVIKHADAGHVGIEVDLVSRSSVQTVWLVVKDDGKGIDETSTPGIGWHMIDARLENFAGWWRRYRSESGGTVVEVGIPVTNLVDRQYDEGEIDHESAEGLDEGIATDTA